MIPNLLALNAEFFATGGDVPLALECPKSALQYRYRYTGISSASNPSPERPPTPMYLQILPVESISDLKLCVSWWLQLKLTPLNLFSIYFPFES